MRRITLHAFICFLLGCLPVQVAFCSDVDSLLHALSTTKEDTGRVGLLRQLAWKYSLINEDSSLMFYFQSLRLAEKLHFLPGQILGLRGIESSYGRKGNPDSSLFYLQKALGVSMQYGDPKYIAMIYSNFASFYSYQQYKPDSSIHYFDLALRTKEKAGIEYEQWYTYMGRGEVYYKLGMNEKGEADILKALQLTETKKIRMDYGMVLFRLIRNYFDLGEWDKYSKWVETYIEFIGQGNPMINRTNVFHRGLYFFEDDTQPEKVLPVLKQITAVHRKNGNTLAWIDALEYMSGVQRRAGKPFDAIKTLEEAIAACKAHNKLFQQEIYYQWIAELYEEENQPEKALNYFKLYKTIQDSVEVLNNRNHIAELEIRYETFKKEEELKRQGLELEKKKLENRNILWVLLILGLLVLATAAYLGLKIRTNRSLKEKNKIISSSLDEKNMLLHEIHHRVKNNLQVISSLLNLQSRYIEDPTALAAIKDGRNRVNSMSLIHQNLYGKEHITSMNVAQYLEKLSDSLFQSYNINRERVKLTTAVDPVLLDIDVLIPLGLILNELISNSLKHAFPDERSGMISIALTKQKHALVLEVKDNGIGGSSPKPDTDQQSFGMELVRTFAQKLKATLEIHPQPGMTTRLTIPHPET